MAPQAKRRSLPSSVFAPLEIEDSRRGSWDCGQVLGCFRFGDSAFPNPVDRATDLRWLGGDQEAEVWKAQGEVRRDGDDWLSVSCTDEILLVSLETSNVVEEDPAQKARMAYRRMVGLAKAEGFPWLLRAWNFIPGINRGDRDAERYRRFCLGRSLGLEDQGVHQSELCAATAVGTHGERLIVHLLAGTKPGIPLENPRQMAAYHYPRIYGVRSPSFARAMALPLAGGRFGLLVSGTASIVGHRTLHPYQTLTQVKETIQNLRALLSSARERLGHTEPLEFGSGSLLRVYVRQPALWPEIADHLRSVWPEAPLIGLEAEICRRDLMVEIEAFHPV